MYDIVFFTTPSYSRLIIITLCRLIRRRVKRDEEIACFGELGCFRDEGPFDYFDMLPNSPEEVCFSC